MAASANDNGMERRRISWRNRKKKAKKAKGMKKRKKEKKIVA